MFQRFVKNYNELLESGKIETEYPYTYKDFVTDDEAYFQSEDFIKDKTYWTDRFQELPERLFEKIDANVYANKSSRKELVIKRADYNLLAVKAKECKCSTFHMILGVLYLYFSRKHQNKDFAIGLPVLNRGKSIFKRTVGLFMGVSALRMEINLDNTFEDLVHGIRQQLRQDYRHQRFPMGKLIQELDAFRDKDRLFNITLSYEKQNYADHFGTTKTQVIPLSHHAERVALAVYVREFDESEDVKIDFDYNTNYFSEDSIAQIVTHFDQLVSSVIADPYKPLTDYSYLTAAEREKVLYGFNQTDFKNPVNTTLVELFKKQAFERAGQVAVKDETYDYTYHKVDALSDRVAHCLNLYLGPRDRSPVAVLMERSADMIAILLGILKTGRAYIPLDPGFPKDRIKHIIEHSQVDCIVASDALKGMIDAQDKFLSAETIINVDISTRNKLPLNPRLCDTAYIIYTSGSTGTPKGVEISHQALINFLYCIQKQPGVGQDDLLFSVTTQSFDISILEFFTPLISGASIYMANKTLLDNPIAIIDKLKEIRPSIMQATPSFYQMLFNAGWEGDKEMKVLCGGDLLSQSLAGKLTDSCQEVWNMYGPTETTIWSSSKQILQPSDASNIGKPIHNTSIYILDDQLKPLPIGSQGAIYISGQGLAKGYYKDKPLTLEKFADSPFKEDERIYETGDLGRWNTDGEIEFLGRNDHQVKVRGYRIELGEIETKLNQMQAVESSVVVAKKNPNQEAVLIAFVIFKEAGTNPATVLDQLKSELPEYMIPYVIVPVDAFPLTPNKKVNRKELAQYEIETKAVETEMIEPVTALETQLCAFYQQVLNMDSPIGTNNDFFALGGHSLNAVKLISLINEELQYQLSLKTIFVL